MSGSEVNLRVNDSGSSGEPFATTRAPTRKSTAKRAVGHGGATHKRWSKRAQLDDDAIDAFDCLYLASSTDPADKDEFQAYCSGDQTEVTNDVGFRRRQARRAQNKGKRKADAAFDASVPGAQRERDATDLARDEQAVPTITTSATPTARVQLHARQQIPTDMLTDPAAIASLSSAQLASLASAYSSVSSVLSTRSLAGSAVPVELFSSVLEDINSAQSAIASRESALTAAPTTSSTALSSSATESSLSSAPSSSGPSQSVLPSETSSSAPTPSSTAGSSSGNPHRIRDIVVPSVVVPIGILLLGLLMWFCCYRSRSRDHGKSSVGPISSPMPAGAAAGRQAAGQASNESFATSPSAIGVAVSDPQPRTKWGRRSFVEAFAAGRAARNRGATPQAVSTSTVQGAGRQPSVTNMAEITGGAAGVGDRPYSPATYRPGMQRPLMSPVSHHYDPFVESASVPPSIIAVPPRRSSSLSGASTLSRSDYAPSERGSFGVASGERGGGGGMGPGALAGGAVAAAGAAGLASRGRDDEDDVEEVRTDLPPPIVSELPYQSGAIAGTSSASVVGRGPGGGGGGGPMQRMYTADTGTSGEGQFFTASSGVSMDSGSDASRQGGRPSGGSGSGLSADELIATPQQAPVNFGSGSSSGGGSGDHASSAGAASVGAVPPRPDSRSSSLHSGGTPRLGAGHGSMSGMRKGDGSWW